MEFRVLKLISRNDLIVRMLLMQLIAVSRSFRLVDYNISFKKGCLKIVNSDWMLRKIKIQGYWWTFAFNLRFPPENHVWLKRYSFTNQWHGIKILLFWSFKIFILLWNKFLNVFKSYSFTRHFETWLLDFFISKSVELTDFLLWCFLNF